MDALSLVRSAIDVEVLLNHYRFEEMKDEGNIIRACCKLHNGNNPTSFAINRETGFFYCHTNCGGGDAFSLVQKMQGISFAESVKWLADFFHVDITGLEVKQKTPQYIKEMTKWIQTMEKLRRKYNSEYNITYEGVSIKKFRNFQESTIQHFNTEFVRNLNLTSKKGFSYIISNRLLFPIMQNDVQVGIALRRTVSSDSPKWLIQPFSLNLRSILYNYDRTKDSTHITVCEGILDVWAFHEIGIPAVGTFGAHITDEQIALLLRTGADITLAFDGDKAGRSATQQAKTKLSKTSNLSIITLKDGEDPENITRTELKKYYDNRSRCF